MPVVTTASSAPSLLGRGRTLWPLVGATDLRRFGPRMQDIDRPSDIQALSTPPGIRRSRVHVKSVPDVRVVEGLKRISGNHRRRWDIGKPPPVRPPELQRTVRLSGDLMALFVPAAVMPPTEQREIRERRRAAGRPMTDVVPLTDPYSTARKAAAVIPVLECASQCRQDRPGPGADFDHAPVRIVSHDHPARVARQPLRRSRGNALTVLEDRLSGLVRIREDRGVDVDHDLIAFAGGTRIDPVMERRLRHERQGVCPLLLHRRHVLGLGTALLIQRFARGLERS